MSWNLAYLVYLLFSPVPAARGVAQGRPPPPARETPPRYSKSVAAGRIHESASRGRIHLAAPPNILDVPSPPAAAPLETLEESALEVEIGAIF